MIDAKQAGQRTKDAAANAADTFKAGYEAGFENPEEAPLVGDLVVDERGQMRQNGLLNLIVAVAVGLLVFAILASIALDVFFNQDTEGWDDDVVDMWEVVPVLFLVAVILGAIAAAVRQL